MITYLKCYQCLVCGGGEELECVCVDGKSLPFHPSCYEEASGETFVSRKRFTRKEWLNFAGEFYTLAERCVAEDVEGNKVWLLNGELHREDGPAAEYVNGDKEYWLNGRTHREDGPAVEWADGTKYWYLNGENLSEEEHRKRVGKR